MSKTKQQQSKAPEAEQTTPETQAGLIWCVNGKGEKQQFPLSVINGPFFSSTGFYRMDNPNDYATKAVVFSTTDAPTPEEQLNDFKKYIQGVSDTNLLSQLSTKEKDEAKKNIIADRLNELSTTTTK